MLAVLDSRPLTADNWATDTIPTPWGEATIERHDNLLWQLDSPPMPPQALAYAFRAAGATRVLSIQRDTEVTTATTPGDFIEFTQGRATTLFEQIGTGYVQQQPPFCPQLRQALLAGDVRESDCLLILDTLPPPALKAWWHSQGVTDISTGSQPFGTLCRELELCFGVLLLPETEPTFPLLQDLLTRLPALRQCNCDQTMALARKWGKVSKDWRQWFGTINM